MLDNFRRQADAVRSIPLETVLTHWGAERDRRDRAQWRTERGPLSVTGAKFFNWHRNEGGGGAIDLVMHSSGSDVREAVGWLQQHLGSGPAAGSSISACSWRSSSGVGATAKPRQLRLPVANLANLDRVRRYLIEQRCLAADILEPLIEAGKVYADARGNAASCQMITRHPSIKRLRPTAHDWNDALVTSR